MKVIISGYYGYGNLGDEAILRVIVAKLREAFPKVELVVLSQTPNVTAKRYGVRAIGRWNFLEIENELKSTSLFISGGGGLLQDRTSWRSPLYYLGLIKMAKRHCPVVMLGQGIGPISRNWVRLLTWRAIQAVDFALMRDELSLNEVTSAGINGASAIAASDLVMLDWPLWADVRESTSNAIYFGVSLTRALPSQFRKPLAEQLDRVSKQNGLQALFMIFNEREDRAVCEEVAGLMESPTMTISPTLNESKECFSQVKYVMGMRFHSLVFATLATCPFISLTNDPKQEKLLCQLKQAGCSNSEFMSLRVEELINQDLAALISCLDEANNDLRERLSAAGMKLYTETRDAMSRTCREISSLLKLN